MINYEETNLNDILKIVGIGAPGYAELGDLVRVTKINKRLKHITVENKDGNEINFLYDHGTARLEATEWTDDFPK